MTDVILSFLALLSLPVAIIAVKNALWAIFGRRPWPPMRDFAVEVSIALGITVVVTLVICVVLTLTGFTESFFFRPSDRDYGEAAKLDVEPEVVRFASADGTPLEGWFLAAKGASRGTVVHLHGSDRNITFTIANCHWLTEQGFDVFVFDYRGYGASEGEPSYEGVLEDAVAAIRYVRARPGVDAAKLFLWGESMGGQLAITAADRAGTEGLRGIVAEATYASHAHHAKDKVAGFGPLWLVQWGMWLLTSDALSARDVVGRLAPVPLLIVHGTEDEVVAPYHGEWLHEAARDPKEIWRVEGAGHLRVFHRDEARDRLVAFFERCLREAEGAGEG